MNIKRKDVENMLLNDEIEIMISPRTLKHYRDKGYNIPMKYSEKSGKNVLDKEAKVRVLIKDLPESSHVKIQYRCDNCGKIFSTEYHDWLTSKSPELGDFCKKCAREIKFPKAMLGKYGCDNPANDPSATAKKKKTNLAKYGTEWAIASEQVKASIKNTMKERYDVENPMQNERIKDKVKATNQEKFGGNSPICDKEVREKSIMTCLERYGVKNPFQNKEVQAKARATLYANGNTPTSKAEGKMCELLFNIYGEDNCHPNYPVGNLSLDCLVEVNQYKIDFEYDGLYWHKNRGQYDASRNAVLMNEGYRIVRIKANNQDTLPSIEQIQKAVDYLVKDNHHLAFINMNT